MPYAGPTITGISGGYDVLDGAEYRLFAAAAITDPSSQQVTLTVTLSDTGVGSLFDPEAATDGGTYDAATGTYTVSGTLAQASAALGGLEFVAAANPSSGYATLSFAALDGKGKLGGPDASVSLIAGTTYSGSQFHDIALASSGPPVGVSLADTGGTVDVISYAAPGDNEYAIVRLDSAQAIINTAAVLYLAGDEALDSVTLTSTQWDAAYGDGGDYELAGALLTVIGDDAFVLFAYGTNEISFVGSPSANYRETVSGYGGTLIETDVSVDLTGGDDIIYFATDDDALTLRGGSPGVWSTLYASGGEVDLKDASLSVFGGGVTLNAVSGDDAVSLYQTDGVADVVNGDGVTVALDAALGKATGTGDRIWFVGGANSTLTIQGASGIVDYAYGPGTIDLASADASIVSDGGGALVDFLAPGDAAYLSNTFGVWDRVEGASGATMLRNAQAVIDGGNQNVYSTSGDADDQITFRQTGGNWDSFYGEAASASVDDAQVNVFGEISDLYLSGADAQASFYAYDDYGYDTYLGDNVHATNATLDVNSGYLVNVIGGGDRIYVAPSAYSLNTLSGTNGDWDTVYGQNLGELSVQAAQVSVVGGGDGIYATGGSAVSLYRTAGADDAISATGSAITLNGAGATLSGNGDYFYFGAGANALNLASPYDYSAVNSHDDVFTFAGAFGVDTIIGFDASDTIQLSKSQFADYSAFQRAFVDSGGEAVLTVDADDKVIFVGMRTSAVTASQVKFI